MIINIDFVYLFLISEPVFLVVDFIDCNNLN